MNQSETEIEILAEKIARWARARSAEIERDRRLPDELVTRLREAGLLREIGRAHSELQSPS